MPKSLIEQMDIDVKEIPNLDALLAKATAYAVEHHMSAESVLSTLIFRVAEAAVRNNTEEAWVLATVRNAFAYHAEHAGTVDAIDGVGDISKN